MSKDHKCTHPIGQCKIFNTDSVIPNGFNIVLDKVNPLTAHVLQVTDIKKHKWNDCNVEDVDVFDDCIDINFYGFRESESAYLSLSKDDVIAMAKHFGIMIK